MINTYYIVQKFDRKLWEWVEYDVADSDHYSTLGNAIYFCDRYTEDGEEVRVIKEEVVYEPKPKSE